MDKHEFSRFRKKLNKTQKQMAQLLGVSIKAVHSYEQGWRTVPPAVERQMFFLASKLKTDGNPKPNCWEALDCPEEIKAACPAWEFHSGDLCWFINGTVCHGKTHKTWKEKMTLCRKCNVFKDVMKI
jgi:hypothetical protein